MNGSSFDSIENAVLCFYQSNNTLQAEAQKWLTELQNSPQIWPAIWDKLLPSGLTELQFYGATVLHAKLLKDWDEIPSDQYDALKTKLLEAIVYFKDGPPVVLKRLCISLAVLVLRLTHMFWPNAVSELISLFQNASLFQNVPNVTSENLSWLLMEILQVIPEEFQTIILSKNERIFVQAALEGDSVHVLSFLEAALSSSNKDIRLQAIKCSKSWLEFGFPPESCDNFLDLLIRTVLVTYQDAESFQCCTNAIEAISTLCTHANLTKYPKRVLAFLDKILSLADILCSSPDVVNCDIIKKIYTLFISMGENHLRVFLQAATTTGESESFQKLLIVILQCSNAPGSFPKDESYSIQAFNFWYTLQDELTSNNYENGVALMEMVKPYYKRLIVILMEKSMQPLDLADWSLEDKNTFRCYRQDIADTFMYCASILKHELLEIISQHLEMTVANMSVLADWRKVDSYLFAFIAISESAMSENEKILRCILLVMKLPLDCTNVQVSYTVMEVFAAYAEWLFSYPQLLDDVFNLIFSKVGDPRLAAPATLALKDIIRECKTVLTVSQASNVANKMMALLNSSHLKSNEQMRLMFSLSVVISLLPVNDIEKSLESVASEHLKRLQELVGIRKLLTAPNDQKKTEQEITDCVNIFAQIFLGLSAQPPIPQFKLLQILLPVFEKILLQCKHQKTIDATCATLKCSITELGDTCIDLLPNIQHIVVNSFYINQHNTLLELAKQLLLLFGSNEAHTEKMSEMLEQLCARTLASFENTTAENVSNQTSLFEHFYSFCTNVLKKNCKLLLNTGGINHGAMFRYAGVALCAQEAPTVKSASSFLCNAITVSREHDALLAIVQTHGAELVYHILLAIGKISPRNCWESVANVLVALSKKYCDWLSRCLDEILTPGVFPSPRATPAAKKSFIKAFLREKANKRRVLDATKEFAFLCRGLLHKDYVEQASSAL